MDEIEVNVSKTPLLILPFGHLDSYVLAVVVVPELGGDEDFLSLDQAVLDGLLDTLTSLLFILVVVGSVEESVAGFDGL